MSRVGSDGWWHFLREEEGLKREVSGPALHRRRGFRIEQFMDDGWGKQDARVQLRQQRLVLKQHEIIDRRCSSFNSPDCYQASARLSSTWQGTSSPWAST